MLYEIFIIALVVLEAIVTLTNEMSAAAFIINYCCTHGKCGFKEKSREIAAALKQPGEQNVPDRSIM